MHLGSTQDGWTHERAKEELAYTLGRVRRGEWEPEPDPAVTAEAPSFREFATDWLADREPELRPATIAAYRWELVNHLLPFFHGMRVDRIDVAAIDRYRQCKVSEGKLGATSIKATIDRLGQVLDVAQERGVLVRTPYGSTRATGGRPAAPPMAGARSGSRAA